MTKPSDNNKNERVPADEEEEVGLMPIGGVEVDDGEESDDQDDKHSPSKILAVSERFDRDVEVVQTLKERQ